VDGAHAIRIGTRFSVRYRLPDGRASDVIGLVEDMDDESVVLVDRSEVRHRLDRSTILATRAVPVARGPDPGHADPRTLELIAADSWHDQVVTLGEWRLRSAGGATSRANSCLAVGDPGRPVDEAAAEIVRYAAAHRIDPVAQLVCDSSEERTLRDLGWGQVRTDVAVLVARLVDLCARPGSAAVTAELAADWFDRYQVEHRSPADDGQVRRLLTSGRAVFASRHADGTLVAMGRATLGQDWMTLFGLWTDPVRRQQGLTRDVVASLGWWAAGRGGRSAQLQVDTANTGALTAYARLGFVTHHHYRYLAPGGQLQRISSPGS